MSRLTKWFLPETPNLLGMLDQQVAITLRGMREFMAWSAGDEAAGVRVRAVEHEADAACRVLRGALRQAFTTPLEPEDLFSLSERLDLVLNEAKRIVREAELLGVTPDEHMARMGAALLTATEHLAAGIALLGPRPRESATYQSNELTDSGNGNGNHRPGPHPIRALRRSQATSATDAAEHAVKAERAVEHEYQRAMSGFHLTAVVSEPFDMPAVMAVLARQEIYRRFAGVGDAVVKVADRVWYATVKNA